MKRISRIILAATLALAATAACKKEVIDTQKDYLEVVPTSIAENLDGQGDGIVLAIKSNIQWTIDVVYPEKVQPWINFESTSGTGSSEVFGAILRGSLLGDRECTITVSGVGAEEVFTTVIPIKQGIFVPVYFDMDLARASKYASGLKAGEKAELPDYAYLKTVVASETAGGNLPENCVIVSDGSSFIRLETTQKLAFGDSITLETTGSYIGMNEKGTGIVIYPAEGMEIKSTTPAVKPEFKATKIDAEALPRCENMLVTVRSCQPAKEYAGMNWGNGEVPMELPTTTTPLFYVKTAATCPLATQAIPLKSGRITGYVIDGQLRPRGVADVALTKDYDVEEGEYYTIKPMVGLFKCSTSKANQMENGKIEGTSKLVMSACDNYSEEGAAIEKVGQNGALKIVSAVASPWNSCFTTINWTNGDYYLYTMPVNQEVYGNLEFNFSISSTIFSSFGKWEVSWSTDNTNWNAMNAVYSQNQLTEEKATGTFLAALPNSTVAMARMVAEFDIPKAQAVSSGNLYFKVQPQNVTAAATKTVRTNCGFYVCTRQQKVDLDDMDYIAAQTFDHCKAGNSTVIGTPVYYYSYCTINSSLKSEDGWTGIGSARAGRGCAFCSTTTETVCAVASPALTALTSPTNITVTFKCAPYLQSSLTPQGYTPETTYAPGVAVEGAGTVGEISFERTYGEDPCNWNKATVQITGADATTIVKVGNVDANASARCYIDDIIITR